MNILCIRSIWIGGTTWLKYIYIFIGRTTFQIITNTTTLSWVPLFLEKIIQTRKKEKKEKENIEGRRNFWKKNLKYILKHLSPFFYNSISNDLSYNTQRLNFPPLHRSHTYWIYNFTLKLQCAVHYSWLINTFCSMPLWIELFSQGINY